MKEAVGVLQNAKVVDEFRVVMNFQPMTANNGEKTKKSWQKRLKQKIMLTYKKELEEA